jgi:hypothetical protein
VTSSADRGGDRRFTPTSGTVMGWLGVGVAAVVLVAVLVDDQSLGAVRFCLAVAISGLLVWCYLLRPRVVIGSDQLELRNAFSSWHVPLADIRRVRVRAITSVHTDERRYDGVAIGRPVRAIRSGRSVKTSHRVGFPGFGSAVLDDPNPNPARGKGESLGADQIADLVTEQILAAADAARAGGPEPGGTGVTARRTWAVPELVALGLLALAFVVLLVI